jgi:hypothetical protein
MLTPNRWLTENTSFLFREGVRLVCEHRLEHLLVERQVGDEVFEASDLLLRGLSSTRLRPHW